MKAGRFADFRENFPVSSGMSNGRVCNPFNPNMIGMSAIGTGIALVPRGVSHYGVRGPV